MLVAAKAVGAIGLSARGHLNGNRAVSSFVFRPLMQSTVVEPIGNSSKWSFFFLSLLSSFVLLQMLRIAL